MFTPAVSVPQQFRPWEVFLEHSFLTGPLATGLSPTLNSFRVVTCFISPVLENCVWLKVFLKSAFVEGSNQLMYIKLSFIIGTVIWIPVMGSFAYVPILCHSVWGKDGHGCLAYNVIEGCVVSTFYK